MTLVQQLNQARTSEAKDKLFHHCHTFQNAKCKRGRKFSLFLVGAACNICNNPYPEQTLVCFPNLNNGNTNSRLREWTTTLVKATEADYKKFSVHLANGSIHKQRKLRDQFLEQTNSFAISKRMFQNVSGKSLQNSKLFS